jgi:hypothetical protein
VHGRRGFPLPRARSSSTNEIPFSSTCTFVLPLLVLIGALGATDWNKSIQGNTLLTGE